MARGIPNRLPSGKAAPDASPLRMGAISTDFAAMARPEWRISDGLVPYDEALATMEARVADIRAGRRRELVWLLEHPPLYTAGTSAKPRRPAAADALSGPCRRSRRAVHLSRARPAGGLRRCSTCARRGQDVRRFVADLEEWTIRTLARFNVHGRAARRPGRRLGARRDGGRARTRSPPSACASATGCRSTASSINVEPDLAHYAGIVPCGIAEHGVTSLVDLGLPVTMADLDMALLAETFDEVFGTTGGSALDVTAVPWRRRAERRPAPPRRSIDRRHSRPASGGPCGRPRSSPTTASSPTISASTPPSVRLRTQPARPRRWPVASPSRDSRRPAPDR